MNLVEAVHKMFSNFREGLQLACSKPKPKNKIKYKKLTKKKAR